MKTNYAGPIVLGIASLFAVFAMFVPWRAVDVLDVRTNLYVATPQTGLETEGGWATLVAAIGGIGMAAVRAAAPRSRNVAALVALMASVAAGIVPAIVATSFDDAAGGAFLAITASGGMALGALLCFLK